MKALLTTGKGKADWTSRQRAIVKNSRVVRIDKRRIETSIKMYDDRQSPKDAT
jgi:hypothetical protein